MTKKDLIRKLTSRKLWMAIAAFVSLVAVACGATEAQATQITALIMAGATVIGYILGEGLIDAARVRGGEDTNGAMETGDSCDH